MTLKEITIILLLAGILTIFLCPPPTPPSQFEVRCNPPCPNIDRDDGTNFTRWAIHMDNLSTPEDENILLWRGNEGELMYVNATIIQGDTTYRITFTGE